MRRVLLLALLIGLVAVAFRRGASRWEPAERTPAAHEPTAGVESEVAILATSGEASLRVPVVADETREPLGASNAPVEFFGRVIDAAGDTPIRDAYVEQIDAAGYVQPNNKELISESDLSARTDADGRFHFVVSTRDSAHVRVSAQGFTHVLAHIDKEHTTPETARELRMFASPRIRVTVDRGSQKPPYTSAEIRIDLSTALMLSSDPIAQLEPTISERSGVPDPEGRFVFEDLPIGQRFGFEFMARGGKPLLKVEVITLRSGETQDFTVRDLGEPSLVSILGKLLDTYDVPIGDQEVWMMPNSRERIHALNWTDVPAQVTRTADDGSFRFDEVPAVGRVLVGTSPPKFHSGKVTLPNGEAMGAQMGPPPEVLALGERAVAPVAEVLMLAPTESGVIHVVLRASRGVFVRGHVVDPQGRPVAHVLVGLAWDAMGGTYQNTVSDDDGRFVFGPCGPGVYSVYGIDLFLERFAASEHNTIQAGDQEVIVQLKHAGRIRGRTIDAASGELVTANLCISGMTTSAQQGVFDQRGLSLGTYDVVAHTQDGRIGVKRVTVDATVDPPSVDILISAGAKVRARIPPGHFYCVYQGEALVYSSEAALEDPAELTVPSGELRVEFLDQLGKSIESIQVNLAPGEVRAVSPTSK